MKFQINAIHLGEQKITVAVAEDGRVSVVTQDNEAIAAFPAGSVIEKPFADMLLDVQLTGKQKTIEIFVSKDNIVVSEDDEVLSHPSYQDVQNTAAREFAAKHGVRSMRNHHLNVVREALAEAEQLREELRKHKMVC